MFGSYEINGGPSESSGIINPYSNFYEAEALLREAHIAAPKSLKYTTVCPSKEYSGLLESRVRALINTRKRTARAERITFLDAARIENDCYLSGGLGKGEVIIH